jgi:hypothetical protein
VLTRFAVFPTLEILPTALESREDHTRVDGIRHLFWIRRNSTYQVANVFAPLSIPRRLTVELSCGMQALTSSPPQAARIPTASGWFCEMASVGSSDNRLVAAEDNSRGFTSRLPGDRSWGRE